MKKVFISLFLITTTIAHQKDGSLDRLFGTNGQVVTCADDIRIGLCVVIQSDNKIVVGGIEDSNFLLVRYNTDGTLDSSFGTNGEVVTDFGASTRLFALGLQPDGKIVAGGDLSNNFLVARYNSNGALDSTFGTGGFVNDVGASRIIQDIAIQANAKIVAVGGDQNVNFGKIVRYNSDGTRDASFGINGLVTVTIPGSTVNLIAVQLQADNKIIVVGTISTGGARSLFLARYLGNGDIDTGFGNNGFQTLRINNTTTEGRDVAIQADGNIVASILQNFANVFLARFTADGFLDNSFGDAGVATVFQGGANNAVRIQLQSDGKIVVAGTRSNAFFLARVTGDGELDTSFGTNGITTTAIFGLGSIGLDLAINSQGKILVTGRVSAQNICIALAQYQVNSLGYSQTSQALWTRYYNQNIKQQFTN